MLTQQRLEQILTETEEAHKKSGDPADNWREWYAQHIIKTYPFDLSVVPEVVEDFNDTTGFLGYGEA